MEEDQVGEIQENVEDHSSTVLGTKKLSRKKLAPLDAFDVEASKIPENNTNKQLNKGIDWSSLLLLAFQSIGIVYGDIGTSPLYTLAGIFPDGVEHNDDILGVLSLIIWLLTLITLIKYVFVVLSANDNGDGGTFALYSLICRSAKVGLLPNEQVEDKDVSNYQLQLPGRRLNRATKVKSLLEKSQFAKYVLLFMTMIGTCMIIGDGILTPCISVLSAVGGIKLAVTSLTDTAIMWISVVILVVIFQVQRFGTDKIGYSFAPIISLWFIAIGLIGFYNFFKYDPGVIKAINPMYIVRYFIKRKKNAWISLGGVVLCLTGSEALFADLGHFSVRSIQLSTCSLVYPSILLAYVGQASYLRKHNLDSSQAFYKSIPGPLYWPMFVMAVLASIIASQALISATFSIIQQALALGCFPRVKVMHTSSKYKGQVYVPEINNLLMLACVGVTLGFENTLKIGNAYGIAVVFVMTLTSTLLVLVMIMIWKINFFFIILYAATIYLVELLLLSSVLYKFVDGGYLPLAFSAILAAVMFTWNYAYRKKYTYELKNQVPIDKLKEISCDSSIHRLPGLGLFYSKLVHGISPIFTHYVGNVPALHTVLVFLSIKSLPISKIPEEERFLFRRVGDQDIPIFQCVVRYGYNDKKNMGEFFEKMLLENLKEFIRRDIIGVGSPADGSNNRTELLRIKKEEAERQVLFVENECGKGGIVHLMGESEVIASQGSGYGRRLLIDYGYNILTRCVRKQVEVFSIPYQRLVKVGMTYEL
ncbi:hypothetical protein ACHQM5_004091 [Ranunculus cassubicifolius]